MKNNIWIIRDIALGDLVTNTVVTFRSAFRVSKRSLTADNCCRNCRIMMILYSVLGIIDDLSDRRR